MEGRIETVFDRWCKKLRITPSGTSGWSRRMIRSGKLGAVVRVMPGEEEF